MNNVKRTKSEKEVKELELQGEVIEIIYKNEINSYCIAVLKIDKEATKAQNKKEKQDSDYSQIRNYR